MSRASRPVQQRVERKGVGQAGAGASQGVSLSESGWDLSVSHEPQEGKPARLHPRGFFNTPWEEWGTEKGCPQVPFCIPVVTP